MTGRTVHGRTQFGGEIVSYGGEWFLENHHAAAALSLDQAVWLVLQDGAQAFLGRPGGRRFDAAVAQEVFA